MIFFDINSTTNGIFNFDHQAWWFFMWYTLICHLTIWYMCFFVMYSRWPIEIDRTSDENSDFPEGKSEKSTMSRSTPEEDIGVFPSGFSMLETICPLTCWYFILGWKSHLMNTHGGETMLPIISRHMHILNRMIEHLKHPIVSENMPSMSSTLGHIPNILNITNICQSCHGLCQPTSRILLHQIRFNLDELSRAFQV